jgi:hypothetical protein
MRVFCVASHHDICSDPFSKQGVFLTAEMLKAGIWFAAGSSGEISDDKIRKVVNLQRSGNQQEYIPMLEALIEMSHRDASNYFAVISFKWDSHFNCFVVPKRVWMSAYHNNGQQVLCYSHHKDGKPMYSILELHAQPTFDKDAWRRRLHEDIFGGPPIPDLFAGAGAARDRRTGFGPGLEAY